MAKDRIKVLGDWSAWAEPVRQGRLIRPDGESIWILIRRRPEFVFEPPEWKIQKAHSRLISRVDHPAVLRLLHAAKIEEAPAWVYEGFQGVSVSRILAVNRSEGQGLPARAALEMVERAVQGLRAALSQGSKLQGDQGAFFHPGPSPTELLIDAVGAVKLAGFAIESDGGPEAGAEGYVPAVPGTPEQRGAYGVSALLVHLLGGERPGVSGVDAERQRAVIRRALIRVLARPGEAVSEALVDVIKAGLSFDPDERPDLTVFEDEVASAATALGSPSLRVWAPNRVPAVLMQQEAGYPDPDTARPRRHIDLADDSSSYEAPPIRSSSTESAPRDVATIMAKVDVAAVVDAASEEGSRDSFGAVSQTSFSAIPTSETDVKLASSAILAAEGREPAPVVLDIGGPDDTWEIEPEAEGRMGGWPLVAGLLIGMVIAAIVGWVVVEQMGKQVPEAQPTLAVPVPIDVLAPDAAAPPSPPEEAPFEEESDKEEAPAEEDAEEAETEVPAMEAPEAELPVLEVPVEATEPEPPPVVDPPAAPPAPVEPPPAAEQSTAPEPPASDTFAVSFTNASTSVERMVVKCHKGGKVEGGDLVQIAQAGKGPCRIEGYGLGPTMSVSVVLTGPSSFTCFEDNARACR